MKFILLIFIKAVEIFFVDIPSLPQQTTCMDALVSKAGRMPKKALNEGKEG